MPETTDFVTHLDHSDDRHEAAGVLLHLIHADDPDVRRCPIRQRGCLDFMLLSICRNQTEDKIKVVAKQHQSEKGPCFRTEGVK
jgi:hypothetical protein